MDAESKASEDTDLFSASLQVDLEEHEEDQGLTELKPHQKASPSECKLLPRTTRFPTD